MIKKKRNLEIKTKIDIKKKILGINFKNCSPHGDSNPRPSDFLHLVHLKVWCSADWPMQALIFVVSKLVNKLLGQTLLPVVTHSFTKNYGYC